MYHFFSFYKLSKYGIGGFGSTQTTLQKTFTLCAFILLFSKLTNGSLHVGETVLLVQMQWHLLKEIILYTQLRIPQSFIYYNKKDSAEKKNNCYVLTM